MATQKLSPQITTPSQIAQLIVFGFILLAFMASFVRKIEYENSSRVKIANEALLWHNKGSPEIIN